MAQGKDKTTQQVNANIPEAVVAAFEVARARRRLKKQDALAEAMLQWATQKLRVSINPEQAFNPDQAFLDECSALIHSQVGPAFREIVTLLAAGLNAARKQKTAEHVGERDL